MIDNKRFQWIYIKDNTLELRDTGIVKVFNNERLEELLNDLNDENEQLKQSVKRQQGSNNECEKIKQQRDFYYARLQEIIRIANGDFE